jgi:hypothetical protein
MNEKIVEIKKITFDEKLYPRIQSDWMISYSYSEAMKSGSKFPPITIAELDGKYVLVDGKHRLDAYNINKQTHVQAIVLSGLSKEQVFAEAVFANTAHGKKLSNQERAYCIQKLQEFKFSLDDISKIVHIPTDKLTMFVADRLSNSITGKAIMLKSPIMNMAGQTVGNDIIEGQHVLASRNQHQILSEVIFLFETGTIDIEKNKKLIKKLKSLLKNVRI